LARQVAQGAPADVVLLANEAWTDHLVAGGHIIDPIVFTGNRLVMIGQPEMVNESVPAGIYGRAALTQLGLWEALAPMIVETQNVRAALALVARGEAPLGIVYQSDALLTPDLPIVARFPQGSHPTIAYYAAFDFG